MFNLNPRYQPLAPSNDSSRPRTRLQRFHHTTSCYLLAWLITIAISASIGSLIGLRHRPCECSGIYSNPTIPLDTQKETFTYNRTFGADPREDPNTQAAWDSIVPFGQGTVRYASPETEQIYYTVSAVHQLHCLWSIHKSYYRSHVHGVTSTEHGDEREHHAKEKEQRHMRHCFDYLRQSLMCAADATLEPVDAALGGVTGWGVQRVCRDYVALAGWAEERRVSDAKGFQ
ncbi:uncharacterized protein BO97DRAFT_453456 [Aspergillus homomorphus CBS 101889]|uniref:Tat pathway signal sequence n=1 Tax=Aspergillus homomorphus (strain CBS 101889) TaxID=1450537 RepID=A0A395HV67_ASPHC|nr:hypothetical protein BO97DRAFT_453456 [Aspergillus homomorphus CBS 101889]RAL11832.1 hypothetical protein BO97DRAFT_453456 [Aspergillus homomorphus CBS 101889]